MYFRTEGVILKKRNFGEADRILTIYTRDFGKVVAIVKGARRPKSKKAGHLELGNWCKLFIARGKNIDLLTEVEVKQAFGIKDFKEVKANKIYHLLELVESLTAPYQKNSYIFKLLLHFLNKVELEDFNLVACAFKVKLLSSLGFYTSTSLSDSNLKRILTILEKEDFEEIKQKIRLSQRSYLNLSAFLDSIVENLTQQKLSTVRFLQ